MKLTTEQLMISIDEYLAVLEDEDIDKAANIMVNKYKHMDFSWWGYEALFVKDKHTLEYVGFLTLRSILKVFDLKKGYINGKSDYKVKNIMYPINERLINKNANMEDIISFFNNKQVNSIIIKDNNKITGVIRAIDLLWQFEELL